METCGQSSILCRPHMGSVLDGISRTATARGMSWKYDSGKLIADWIDFPEASSAVHDLIKCRCNPDKGCHRRCKCVNAPLPCTELCMCQAECEHEEVNEHKQ